MRFIRLQTIALMLGCCATVGTLIHVTTPVVDAQSIISGDITGSVTDASGAALPGAKVVVTSLATGQAKTVVADSVGGYRVPLLAPGKYKVAITMTGFDATAQITTVAAGSVATVNLKLSVGKASETVEVSSDAIQSLDVDNAQISTSFDLAQIQNLPNPGNDLTFVAQTTPGAVMNTQAGYGNFSVNGLPGTSNMYTVNGAYEGDPYLNVGNSGASNLLLGNNDVDTVTVTTNSFDVAFGGLGGAQVNEITRSGTSQYHGNAVYWWNGRAMNANSWFNKYSGTERAFDNANQWAASLGGPIKKDKIFGFINTEGIRVLIPTRANVYAPSPAYQAAVLDSAKLTDSGIYSLVPYGNLAANGLSSEAPLYQKIFSYYNNAKNFSKGHVDANDPGTWIFNGQAVNFAKEWMITDRVDVVLNDRDSFFVHSKVDKGTQPTQTSYLDPLFNALSPQPSYEGQLGYTHTFSSALTNQFLFAASYARTIFTNTNAAKAFEAVPFVLYSAAAMDPVTDGTNTRNYDWSNGADGNVGGANYVFPQGRMVTGYQFNDDLTWLRGRHTVKVGYTFRRDDITDYTSSEYVYANGGARSIMFDPGDFAAGYSDRWDERFPTRESQPVALYVEGAYVQDQWKPLPNLTVTAGLRVEHNSNPICVTNCISNFAQDFNNLPSATNSPYNTILASGRHRAYFKQQSLAWQPRLGFAYLPFGASSKTTVRGGIGLFNDYFPASIMGNLVSNVPSVDRFQVLGPYYGGNSITNDPTLSDSGHALAKTSNTALQSLYSKGAFYHDANNSNPTLDLYNVTNGVFSRPTVVGTARQLHLPTYIEWSLAVEHEIYRNTALKISYVGNRSYHQPVSSMPNAFQSSGLIASLPTSRPNAALGSVTVYSSGSYSNYNGMQAQLLSHAGWVSYTLNYAWGHALDTTSNGGFESFGDNASGQINPKNLRQNYGNADYDVRQYISANYVVSIPHTKGPRLAVDNWELSGTIFHNTGYPFSVVDDTTTISYGSSPLAKQTDNKFNHHCGGKSHAGDGSAACDFASHFAKATDFGQQSRNQLFGPNYTNFDLDVAKGFAIPRWNSAKLKVAVQFFNVFNHPNFSQPDFNLSSSTLGKITSTASTPTSILGSGLGGDASPRLIQLKGTFSF